MIRKICIVLLCLFCCGCSRLFSVDSQPPLLPEPEISATAATPASAPTPPQSPTGNSLFQLSPKETEILQSLPDSIDDEWARRNPVKQTRNNGMYSALLQNDIPLQSGDIILRLTTSIESIAIALTSLSGFSHIGVVIEEGKDVFVVDVHPDNLNDNNRTAIKKTPLIEWSSDRKMWNILHILVLRPKKELFDRQRIVDTTQKYIGETIDFDNHFIMAVGSNRKNKFYCTEFVYEVLLAARSSEWQIPDSKNIIRKVGSKLISYADSYSLHRDDSLDQLQDLLKKYAFPKSSHTIIVSPAAFEYSPDFNQISYVNSNNIDSHRSLYNIYLKTRKKYLALLSLHGLPKSTPRKMLRETFRNAGIATDDITDIMKLIGSETEGQFNVNDLIGRLMGFYANSPKTYRMIMDALQHI